MHTRFLQYHNCYGQEIFFNNKTFLCESMEISKATARYNAHTPISNDGQVTSDYYCSPLPMRFWKIIFPKTPVFRERKSASVL